MLRFGIWLDSGRIAGRDGCRGAESVNHLQYLFSVAVPEKGDALPAEVKIVFVDLATFRACPVTFRYDFHKVSDLRVDGFCAFEAVICFSYYERDVPHLEFASQRPCRFGNLVRPQRSVFLMGIGFSLMEKYAFQLPVFHCLTGAADSLFIKDGDCLAILEHVVG